MKPILLLSLIYGVSNILYFGIAYSFDTEGGGFGVNCIAAGCVELLSFTYLGFFVTRTPRRKGIAFCYGVATIIGLTFAFSVVRDNNLIVTILLCFNRLFSSIFLFNLQQPLIH